MTLRKKTAKKTPAAKPATRAKRKTPAAKPATQAKRKPAPKRKPVRKKKPAMPPVDPAHVDAAVLALVTMLSPAKVADYLIDGFGIAGAELSAVLDAARQRIIQAAGPDLIEMAGQALSRLDQIYELAIGQGEPGIALQTQREKTSILSLKERLAEHATRAGDESTEPADFAAIRAHLGPLGLGPASAGPVELARLAALEIIRTRRK